MPDANGNPLPWEVKYTAPGAPAAAGGVSPQPWPTSGYPALSNVQPNKAVVETQHTQGQESRDQRLFPAQQQEQNTRNQLLQTQLREERIKMGLDPDTGKPAAGGGKIGDDAIADMSPADQAIVKSIVQGRGPQISAYALGRNPQLMRYIQAAYQYEPGTDLTTLQRRQVAATRFLSNPNSPMLRVNQALQHLDRFYNTAHALDNFGPGALGAVGNYARAGEMALTKDPRYQAFATDRDALASELAAAFQGSGQGGALADRNHWREIFSAAQSPEAFDNAIKEAAGLLGGRIEASTAQFKQAVGANADKFDLMSPEARKVYERFTSDDFGTPQQAQQQVVDGMQKAAITLPEGYQQDHAAFLKAHPPGTLTVEDYENARRALDEKYFNLSNLAANSAHGEVNPQDLSQLPRSELDAKQVKAFVDAYNSGGVKANTRVPTGTTSTNALEKAAASAPGVFVANAANAATLGLPELIGGQDRRDAFHLANAAHPDAALVGDIAGSVMPTAAAETGFARAAEALGKEVGGFGKAVGGNMIYQGARGFNDADSGHGVEGGLEGMASGAAGGGLGAVATKGVTPLLSSATQDAMKLLKGTDLTTFQRLGLGKAEEALQGVPGAHGARANAYASWNKQNANNILANISPMTRDAAEAAGNPIATSVPKNIPAGTKLNDFLHTQLGNAYETIKPRLGAPIDPTFSVASKAVTSTLPTTFKNQINEAVGLLGKKAYDGESYQAAITRLRALSDEFLTQAENGVPGARDALEAASAARKQIDGLVARQQPELTPELKGVQKAWAMQMRVQNASNRALAQNGGVYAPGQMLTTIKGFDSSTNKATSATGKALMQPEALAAQNVMGSQTVPQKLSLKDMGNAALFSGVTGYGVSPIIPSVAGAIGGAAYLPGIKRITQALVTGERPKFVDNASVRAALANFLAQKFQGNMPMEGQR